MSQSSPNPNTLGEVVSKCQVLMGDPTNRLVSRAYAVPFINQAYEDMTQYIKTGSGKNLEAVVEVLDVPAGTSALYEYQQYGDLTIQPQVPNGPLVGLSDPLRMWVKLAGQLPQFYTPARGPRDTLPHVNPPGIQAGNFSVQVTFAWIGNQLFITPVAQNIDIQVYGRFNPPRLVKDSDVLVVYPDMSAAVAYSATALMGIERTNPAILSGYAERGMAMADNIVSDVIRQTQKNARSLARMVGGRGGSYWGWW